MSLPLPSLNLDLKSVDTTPPRIEDGTKAILEIAKAECLGNKAGDGYNLLVEFKTTDELPNNKGTSMQPGYTLSKYYPLQQAEQKPGKGAPPDFKIDLTKLVLAAYDVAQSEAPEFNDETVSGLVGKRVSATIKLKDDPQYGPSNEVANIKAVPST